MSQLSRCTPSSPELTLSSVSGYYQATKNQHHVLSAVQNSNYVIGCFTPNRSGWTGSPLISTASRRPKKNYTYSKYETKQRVLGPTLTEYNDTGLSQLAIHACGAPLILTRGYKNRDKKSDHTYRQVATLAGKNLLNNNSQIYVPSGSQGSNLSNTKNTISIGVDFKSRLSDDSICNSSSAPDTSLPRIIKPRKRRKKDRKPQSVRLPSYNIMVMSPQLLDPKKCSSVEHYQGISGPCMTPQLVEKTNRHIQNISAAGTLESTTAAVTHSQKSGQHFLKLQFDDNSNISTCCCRLCNPSCRIWAFPLRRSCSDNSAELELYKSSKDFGVIGSNRSWNCNTEWRSSLQIAATHDIFLSGIGNFSGGHPGCEILRDINCEDTYNNTFRNSGKNKTNIGTSSSSESLKMSEFPTAESLLTESINEISKKLMETVELRNDAFATEISGAFSDSVISDNVVFNVDNLRRNDPSVFCCGGINTNFDKVQSNKTLNASSDVSKTSKKQETLNLDNEIKFSERDSEDEVFNCLDINQTSHHW